MSTTYTDPAAPVSVSASFMRAWTAYKANFWLFSGFTFLYLIIAAVLSSAINALIPFGSIVVMALGFVFPVSAYAAFGAAQGGVEVQFADFVTWTPRFGRLFIGSLVIVAIMLFFFFLLALVFGYSVLQVFGSPDEWRELRDAQYIMLIAAGILFILLLCYVLSFAYLFLLLKRDFTIGESLAKGFGICVRKAGSILLIALMWVGMTMLTIPTCGLGMLIVVPLMLGVQYFYLLGLYPDADKVQWDFEQTAPPPPTSIF